MRLSHFFIMKRWTIAEETILVLNYKYLPVKDIEKLIPDRTAGAIRLRANQMGLKREQNKQYNSWSEEEIEFLKTNYSNTYAKNIAKDLDRSVDSIRGMANRLGLKSSLTGKGLNSRRSYSKISIKWIQSFNNPNILHAENEGEQLISGYYVDGFDPLTNTVYEFQGDSFHGNLEVFKDLEFCHPFDKISTAQDLYFKTLDKNFTILEKYNLIEIWESEYKRGLMGNYYPKC